DFLHYTLMIFGEVGTSPNDPPRGPLLSLLSLLSLINKRCRVRLAEGQIPAGYQLAVSRVEDIVCLAQYIVATDFSEAATIRNGRIVRTTNGHVEKPIWAEQQRLRSSAILHRVTRSIEVNMVDQGAGLFALTVNVLSGSRKD